MERAPKIVVALLVGVFASVGSLVASVRADFHDNEINEIMAGLNGDATVQFVEIHMLTTVQNCQGTGHHPTANELSDNTSPPCSTTGTGARLLFFNAAGTQTAEFIFPHNTARGNSDRKILVATQRFVDLGFGVQPDFIMPANVVPNSGKVCYRDRSGALFTINNCVSYGSFTGNREGFGAPAPALPTTGNQSLARVNHTLNNALDFALQAPTPINNAGQCGFCPIANAQNVVTSEDTPIDIALSGTDPHGLPLTFTLTSKPSRGSFGATKPPNLTYTPSKNLFGPDSFTFKVNNGSIDSAVATVAINIAAVNDPPVAFDQTLFAVEGRSIFLNLQASDPEGAFPLLFLLNTFPTHGTLSGTLPDLTYKADSGFVGPDSFTYVVSDGDLQSNIATVSINILADHPPVALGQTRTMTENKTLGVVLAGSDPDSSDELTFTIVTPPSNGALDGTPPGLTYTPTPDFVGSDSFAFKVSDSDFDSDPATVTIDVIANRPPVAFSQSVAVPFNTPVNITLGGTDPDSDSLSAPDSFGIESPPVNGSLSGTLPSLVYTPNTGFVGQDAFSFVANDGKLTSAAATVSVTVRMPPVFIAAAAPNGGDVWRIGSTQTVRWASNGVNGFVNVQLSRDGGATWKAIIKKASNTGSHSWKAAKPATTKGRIRICSITSPSICGTSSGNFTIQ